MQRADVYKAIDGERDYQDWRWGTVQDHPHDVGGWIVIMEQLLADAREEFTRQAGDVGALTELRKVAAVAVACMEQHGVNPRPVVSKSGRRPAVSP
jgi:hypothetical protein